MAGQGIRSNIESLTMAWREIRLRISGFAYQAKDHRLYSENEAQKDFEQESSDQR